MRFRSRFIFACGCPINSCSICWKGYPSSIELLLHLCKKLVEHMCGSVSWSAPSVFMNRFEESPKLSFCHCPSCLELLIPSLNDFLLLDWILFFFPLLIEEDRYLCGFKKKISSNLTTFVVCLFYNIVISPYIFASESLSF